jgi:murE/murF fusion protein
MYLKDFFPNIKKGYQNYFFSGITSNSLKIKKNYIFFAIKGNKFDGHNFIASAINKGARIIIHEKKFCGVKNNILFLNTKNIRKLLAEVSYKIHHKIPKNLVAVTGTNGKSSISDFFFQILNLNKKKVASIGTLGIKKKNSLKSLSNTTIDPVNLGNLLQNLKKQKIDNVIMEASSHGLKQHRLDGLMFNVGIFSNLSHDHLDYHKNFKDYLDSKLHLFRNLVKKNGNVITDQSIPQFNIIKNISKKKKT